MTKPSNSNRAILFPTDHYKRFLNSNRVLFVLIEELFWIVLAFIGILPTSWFTWFVARSFNKLLATPIWRLFASVNNLIEKRKSFKSMVMLITLSLSMILGGLLGYYILYQSPLFMSTVTAFLNQISCPPAISFIGAMLGGIIATLSHKIPPVIGVSLGTFIGSYIPLTIPLIVDVVFVSVLTSAVIFGFIAKKLLRIHFQANYHYANADGYQIDCSGNELKACIDRQAQKFGVSPEAFNNLITLCRNQVKFIKNRAGFFEEYWDFRRTKTNTYKDIYHNLMNQHLENEEDIVQVKKLLRLSSASGIKENTNSLDTLTQTAIKYLPSIIVSAHLNKTGEEIRVLTHQLFLEDGGIEDTLIQPFLMSMNP